MVCALLVTSGCAHHKVTSQNSSSNSSHDVRATRREALAFLAAIKSYNRQAGVAAESAVVIIDREQRNCSSVPERPAPSLKRRLQDAAIVFQEAMRAKLLASRYVALSSKLVDLNPHNRALRTIARADAVVADEARKLKPVRVNFCAALTRWKAHMWSVAFEKRLLEEPFGPSVSINRKNLTAASKTAAATLPQIRKLRLSLTEALEIASSALFF
jgi:hypothetical protein